MSAPAPLPPPGSAASVTGCPELDYAQGQPNLYLMMRRKQELIGEKGLESGFAAYRQVLGLAANVGLIAMPLASDHEFARQHALFYRETGLSGVPFENAPPVVIGEGNHYPLRGVTRAQYVACLPHARVMGRSSAIQCGGQLLLDFQGGERKSLDDELDWDPMIFQEGGGLTQVIPNFHDDTVLELEESFTLLGSHTDFFGHWMVEYLPKLVATILSGAMPKVPLLIDSYMPPSHRQSLELLFGPTLELIEVPAFKAVQVKKLWMAPTLMYMPLHEKRNERFTWDTVAAPPHRLTRVTREMQRLASISLGEPSAQSARVYLARKGFRHRKLVNAAAIEEVAHASGFVIAYPEDLSFAQQVDLLRTASHVIAPEGSALFLTFFSPPGAKVCVLSHPLTDVLADFNALLSPSGVALCAFTGAIQRWNLSTPHDSDYAIEVDRFSTFLATWIDG